MALAVNSPPAPFGTEASTATGKFNIITTTINIITEVMSVRSASRKPVFTMSFITFDMESERTVFYVI